MNRSSQFLLMLGLVPFLSFWGHSLKAQKPVHQDVPFVQDYSIKYYLSTEGRKLLKVSSDRNGNIQVLSDDGLLKPHDGQFLYPGLLVPDLSYRTMAFKKIRDIDSYQGQFVYLDDVAVLSNAWAGKLFSKHGTFRSSRFVVGKDYSFMVSDGKVLRYVKDSGTLWQGNFPEPVRAVTYSAQKELFWVLSDQSLFSFSPRNRKIKKVFKGSGFTSFDLDEDGNKAIIGTKDGYLEVNVNTRTGTRFNKIPVPEITVIKVINGSVWFGSPEGAFMLRKDGKFNYYNGERWLPGNQVVDIAGGPDGSVLVLTDKGLGQICFRRMTLADKAAFYDKQVRQRHIRNGFNASLEGMKHGDLATGYLSDSDNDGLWTSMYLGAEIFRYAVTRSEEALQNCMESLDAMERLYTINSNDIGFPARSFERSGNKKALSDPERWRSAEDREWDWKATTSSDEAIGHIFALGAMAELIDNAPMKQRAVYLIDILMQHIVDHDMYLVDYDGKPTTWGRWNPEYVNARPVMVGDRKINSSNITAMLQTAYHFTGKEVYKDKAFELMHQHGYFENLMRPMKEIGQAPADADELSRSLSEGWNHSDDEMYFLGYWGLYRYAFNDTLKAGYREAIIDHWESERPEKEGAWNIFTALVSDQFDLEEAIWYLQEHPMDLINWDIQNSHRKDIEFTEGNFRGQTITEVLPPDERPVQRHNANMFRLDRTGGNGTGEHSAGDIWLLPYWMGRYLGVIGEPATECRTGVISKK